MNSEEAKRKETLFSGVDHFFSPPDYAFWRINQRKLR